MNALGPWSSFLLLWLCYNHLANCALLMRPAGMLCPKICLVSALSPAFPAQLRATLFISGSLFKALLKTLRRHFLASCALVALLVHPPSSVGAGRSGTLRKVSSLTNSKTHGILPTPHTGATIGAWKDLVSGPDGQSYGYESCTLSTLLFSLPLPRCRRCIRRHT